MNKKYWTEEEDRALLAKVRRHSYNLKKAFAEASRITGRSNAACSQRWYGHLSKQKDSVCFATVCYRGKNINRKNTCKEINKPLTWWNKLLKFLKG